MVAGMLRRDPPDPHRHDRQIVKVILHENWMGRGSMKYDVAVIQVRTAGKIMFPRRLESVLRIPIVLIVSQSREIAPEFEQPHGIH